MEEVFVFLIQKADVRLAGIYAQPISVWMMTADKILFMKDTVITEHALEMGNQILYTKKRLLYQQSLFY